MELDIYIRNRKSKIEFDINNPQASADIPYQNALSFADEVKGIKGVLESEVLFTNIIYKDPNDFADKISEALLRKDPVGIKVTGNFDPSEVLSLITSTNKFAVTGTRLDNI